MDGLLNQDMIKAIESAGLDRESKDLVVKILFKERTKKNVVWDDNDATDFFNSLITDLQGEERKE